MSEPHSLQVQARRVIRRSLGKRPDTPHRIDQLTVSHVIKDYLNFENLRLHKHQLVHDWPELYDRYQVETAGGRHREAPRDAQFEDWDYLDHVDYEFYTRLVDTRGRACNQGDTWLDTQCPCPICPY